MAELLRQRWQSDGSGLTRADRRPCQYDAYIPDKLIDRMILLSGEVAAEVSDAEIAIQRLNATSSSLANTEALARIILRAESVASSRIEGLQIGARRLLRAEAEKRLGIGSTDVTAQEVLGNIDAMAWAISASNEVGDITLELLLEAHRRLLAGTSLAEHGGQLRQEQNWIGGSSYNPCSAAFVPPPPELVPELLGDLLAFCNGDALPAVVQAAIAHAQFETIHPFVDGNGRIGRVLIQAVLRRRGLTSRIIPPTSLLLATWSNEYVSGLAATRYLGPPEVEDARYGINTWIATFAGACVRATQDASEFESRVDELKQAWYVRLGSLRRGSAAMLLLEALPGLPVLTVGSAAEAIGRSFPQTNAAVSRMVAAGILAPISLAKRNRAFEAREIIDAFSDLERQFASPEGDTRRSPPARGVPVRRP